MRYTLSSTSIDKLYLEEMKKRTKQDDLLHLKENARSLGKRCSLVTRKKRNSSLSLQSNSSELQRKKNKHILPNDTIFSEIAGDLFVYNGKNHSKTKLQQSRNHLCMNMLLKKKLNRIDALRRSHAIPQRSSTGSYDQILSDAKLNAGVQNSTFPLLHKESVSRRNRSDIQMSNNLFEQLRRSGIEEKLARRRQKNYLKLCQAMGDFD